MMTNLEKIQNMNAEEMMNYIGGNRLRDYPCDLCAYDVSLCAFGVDCENGVLNWLESEVEE